MSLAGGGHDERQTASSLPIAGRGRRGQGPEPALAGARSAALEAVALAQHHEAAVRPADPSQSSVAAVTLGRLDRGERFEVELNDGLFRASAVAVPLEACRAAL